MIEPADIARFQRHARTFGDKINDAEALGVAAELLATFEYEWHAAIDRLKGEGFSWRELARGTGRSAQALQQEHARWQARQRNE